MTNTLIIPADWIQHLMRERQFRDGQVFASAKCLFSSGWFHVSEVSKIAEQVDASRKTVIRSLKRLIEVNWIGYSKKDRRYFTRSWERIRGGLADPRRTAYLLNAKMIKHFKAYCMAVCVSNLIGEQKRKERPTVRRKGVEHYQVGRSSFKPVAIRALTQIYDLDLASASRMVQDAIKLNLIEVDESQKLKPILINGEVVRVNEYTHIWELQDAIPRIRIQKGKVYIQEARKLRSKLVKRRRPKMDKIETIHGVYRGNSEPQ